MSEQLYDYKLDIDEIKPHKKNKIRGLVVFSVSVLLASIVLISDLYLINVYNSEFKILKEVESVKGKMDSAVKADKVVEIRSPINGIELTGEQLSDLNKNIPQIIMISNNDSARNGQYGLDNADIVYEALTEGGITRFMGVFWSNQSDYWIKPVRSVRKYFLDWALEYGNAVITFSGFAQTNNPDTNAFGVYQQYNPRVTIWDWPFYIDDYCMQTSNSMHCKYTTLPRLFALAEKKGWNTEGWTGFTGVNEWRFEEKISKFVSYPSVTEFSYGFTNEDETYPWRTRWVYNVTTSLYEKYEPLEKHIDIGTGQVITASTVILMIMDIQFTGDEAGRVAYFDIGEGNAFVLRDGVKIDGVWRKECNDCRTRFFEKLGDGSIGAEVEFKPGKIWIAAVPSNRTIKWSQ